MFLWVAIPILVLLVLAPADAYAWGPITHLQVGRMLLESCRDFLTSAAPAILDYPLSYLYGCVAPDRFIAKNLKKYEDHTHNWDQAFNMLRFAGTTELKAFTLGYLSHLACDVVAHNLYVPSKIMLTRGMANRRHSYWELRFDERQPTEAWELARLTENVPGEELLNRYMGMFQSPSLFSYETNINLTRKAFRVMESDRMRRVIALINGRRTEAFDDREVQEYVELSMTCVRDVLENRQTSRCCAADPSGRARIRHAHVVVKAMGTVVGRVPRRVTAISEGHAGVPGGNGHPVILPDRGGSGPRFASLRAPELGVYFESHLPKIE